MSEQLGPSAEKLLPEWDSGPHIKPEQAQAERSVESERQFQIKEARMKALEQPPIPLELPVDENPGSNQPQYIDRAMKRLSLNKELERVRTDLPPGDKLLSQLIHRPLVRQASDVSARTIARPLGLLGGGVLAFCGSVLLLIFDKYIGAKYNFLMFVLFFIVGYVLFSVVELIGKAVSKKR